MSKLIRITDELSLPLDIITMRTAEYGDSGAGKTAFARLLAEKVHEAHHRFCAIDLKNDWWGLKSSADGSRAGIPVVIFGGPRGDVRLFDDAGAALADTVTSIDQSVIIDLDKQSRAKQERFLTSFLDRLYDGNRRPLLLFCDEADRYAPQKPMTQDAVMSLSSSEDIARRGRKRGIGSIWLTQRTAVLNKNVSEFCNLVVIFRTPGSRDLKELEERVGRIANKETVAEVVKLAPGLEDGQAFFLSSHPKLRKYLPDPVRPIQLPLPWTFDSSATPGVGQRRREPKVLAETDLAAIESRMAAQVEKAKAEDPKELRRLLVERDRRIRELEQAKPAPAAAPGKTREVPVIKDGQLQRIERQAAYLQKMVEQHDARVDAFKDVVDPLWKNILQTRDELKQQLNDVHRAIALAKAPAGAAVPVRNDVRNPQPRAQAPQPPRISRPAARPSSNGDGGEFIPNGSQQRVLDAIAWFNSIGVDAPSRAAVGLVARIKPTGGHFTNTIGPLSTNGLIEYTGDGVRLTDAGQALATMPSNPPTIDAYHDSIRKVLKNGATIRIFNAIVDGARTLEEIGQATEIDHEGGHFGNSIGPLGTLGLIERRSGVVTPTELLFPEALLQQA